MKYRNVRIASVLLVVLGGLAFLSTKSPIAQKLAYHEFADARTIFGIPRFWDVVSNMGFLWVGFLGIRYCRENRQPIAHNAWLTMFIGVALVSVGSAYYHWAPDNARLVWDRLPMTLGFMALFVALLAEFVDPRAEKWLLIPGLLVGMLSVLYWYWFDDLRLYIWVQASPLLAILMLLLLFHNGYSHRWFLVLGLGLYILAKVTEHYDRVLFYSLLQTFSGHTIKHILSALAILMILQMLKLRHPIQK